MQKWWWELRKAKWRKCIFDWIYLWLANAYLENLWMKLKKCVKLLQLQPVITSVMTIITCEHGTQLTACLCGNYITVTHGGLGNLRWDLSVQLTLHNVQVCKMWYPLIVLINCWLHSFDLTHLFTDNVLILYNQQFYCKIQKS